MLRFAEPVATIPCMTGAPSYSIDVAQAPPPERIADGAAGLCRWQIERLPFESDVYALAPGDFILAASGPDASRLNTAIEGAEPQRLERSGEDAAWAARLAAGKSRLRIDGPALSAPCGIVLRRAESAALHPRLFQFVSMTPPNDGWLYEETREGEILTMTRNSGVGYELDIPEDGGWRLEVEARSDAPFAIAEAALDGRRLGALAWLEADGEPAIRTLDFTASRGTRRLEIHFLSDAYPPPDEEDLDSDLSLTGVRIAPAADGEARSGGGDILRAVPLVRLPRAFYDDFFQARPGREEGYWEILGDCQASEKPGAGQPEMRLEIPPDSAGANVQSTLFAAEAGRWIYGGFEMRAEDLRNHTANIAALFFDGDRAMLQIQIGYATGLNETQSDWARMPYLFQAPTGAAHCGLRIAIYPNSNRPSSQPGYVEIRHPWGAEAVE
ncbi:MAG: hypothetical protein BWZ10_01561 [candidate division BRC1 bacterium ADurb.BinA364]|nr:MAG: hypothetical protein BWZ10_01561 [candidate division BRC1 bacterium ADurb.BinA364]